MRDVAKRANVSVNTVSLALKDSSRVSLSTKTRVMQAVEELGYTPNAVAQYLRRGMSHTIGIMIPDLRNFHYWDVLEGAEDEAYRHGYSVVIANTRLDSTREYATLRGLLESRYDGIILTTAYSNEPPEDLRHLKRDDCSVVTLGRRWSNCDSIVYFNENAGKLLLEHLYALGHRRIAFVHGVAREGLAVERLAAYQNFVAQHGLHSMIASCGPTITEAMDATNRMLDLDPRPTAIMSVNDYLALGVYRAIMERGLRIPDDISVAGFDNTFVGEYLCPALTSVDVGGQEVGRSAVRLLLERITDRTLPQRIVEIKARLVERESTAPPPDE